jgi:hypothetical protein
MFRLLDHLQWYSTSAKEIEAIKNIATPKTIKELRQFIGMVNYY